MNEEACVFCHGRGSFAGAVCEYCKGAGQVSYYPNSFPQDDNSACQYCGAMKGVEHEDARTMYASDIAAGAPIPLCRTCATDHHGYYDELYREIRNYT